MNRLKAEMAKLQAYWDESEDLLFIFGPGGQIVKVSASVQGVLGYTPEYLEGRSYLEFIHPNDVAPTGLSVLAHTSDGHRVITVRNRYRTKDGHYVWIVWYTIKSGHRYHAVARYVSPA